VCVVAAGLTNAVFPPHATCVVEISTWTDRAHKSAWRSSQGEVARWSPFIEWHVHRLPPEQIAEGFSEAVRRQFWSDAPDPHYVDEHKKPFKPERKRDLMLISAPVFHMRPRDIDAIAARVSGCLNRSNPNPG
jgi:hypothetical protein